MYDDSQHLNTACRGCQTRMQIALALTDEINKMKNDLRKKWLLLHYLVK